MSQTFTCDIAQFVHGSIDWLIIKDWVLSTGGHLRVVDKRVTGCTVPGGELKEVKEIVVEEEEVLRV